MTFNQDDRLTALVAMLAKAREWRAARLAVCEHGFGKGRNIARDFRDDFTKLGAAETALSEAIAEIDALQALEGYSDDD